MRSTTACGVGTYGTILPSCACDTVGFMPIETTKHSTIVDSEIRPNHFISASCFFAGNGCSLTIFLPKLAQPTRVVFFRHLFELAGIEPDAVARRALIDLNFLEAALFERRAAFWALHRGRF